MKIAIPPVSSPLKSYSFMSALQAVRFAGDDKVQPKKFSFLREDGSIEGSKINLGGLAVGAYLQTLGDGQLNGLKTVDRAELIRLVLTDKTLKQKNNRPQQVEFLTKLYEGYQLSDERERDIITRSADMAFCLFSKLVSYKEKWNGKPKKWETLLSEKPELKQKILNEMTAQREKILGDIHALYADYFSCKPPAKIIYAKECDENKPKFGFYEGDETGPGTITVVGPNAPDFENAVHILFHEGAHRRQKYQLDQTKASKKFNPKDEHDGLMVMLYVEDLPGGYIRRSENQAGYEAGPSEKDSSSSASKIVTTLKWKFVPSREDQNTSSDFYGMPKLDN